MKNIFKVFNLNNELVATFNNFTKIVNEENITLVYYEGERIGKFNINNFNFEIRIESETQ